MDLTTNIGLLMIMVLLIVVIIQNCNIIEYQKNINTSIKQLAGEQILIRLVLKRLKNYVYDIKSNVNVEIKQPDNPKSPDEAERIDYLCQLFCEECDSEIKGISHLGFSCEGSCSDLNAYANELNDPEFLQQELENNNDTKV
ncbi:MAG: hypothetical protein WC254_07620 [Candidatus Woesearchaeota archaeon]|jgi:hypothetical protein